MHKHVIFERSLITAAAVLTLSACNGESNISDSIYTLTNDNATTEIEGDDFISDNIDSLMNENAIIKLEGEESIKTYDMNFAKMMLSDNNPHDDAYWTMVHDSGGITEFEKIERDDPEMVKILYENHGLEYIDTPDKYITDTQGKDRNTNLWGETPNKPIIDFCGKYFGNYYRNKTFNMSKSHVSEYLGPNFQWYSAKWSHLSKIDARGRPFQARGEFHYFADYAYIRDDNCVTKVGKYGASGDHGGHLMAAELGGFPRRINLVPQQGSVVNKSLFRFIENAVVACNEEPTVATVYRVTAHYNDIFNPARPSGFTVDTSSSRLAFSGSAAERILNALPLVYGIYIPNGDIGSSKRDAVKNYRNIIRNRCGLNSI